MTTLLKLEGVSKSFGGLQVTRDVSLTLASGDRVALIGPNGAGKTTLVNLITGQLTPSGGKIILGETDITSVSVQRRAQQGLVRTFQITKLFGSLTVEENVILSILQRQRLTRRLFSAVHGMAAVKEEALALLDVVGIVELARARIASLAYGHQRLLELAVGLALKPRVLLLDEPAAGVPHEEAPRILDAIARLPEEIAVLMIEHDMDLVFRFAKRVLVLANGELICEGTPTEISANSIVREAYLGSYADARRHA